MWRPIKDAPRDGTMIMGQDATHKRETWFQKIPYSDPAKYGWIFYKNGVSGLDFWNPTVWEKIK